MAEMITIIGYLKTNARRPTPYLQSLYVSSYHPLLPVIVCLSPVLRPCEF